MAVEREIKLIGDIDAPLPDVTDADRGITVGETKQLRLAAVYYDTPTLSLARSGVTLRARTGEAKPVWTLKLPSTDGDAGLSRPEHEFDEPLGPIPTAARMAARAYVRSQALGPVLRLQTDRAEASICVRGEPVGTLVDDRVEVDGGTSPLQTFREVEVEMEDGVSSKAVSRVVDVLRDAGFGDDEPTPKAIRALGARASEPPDVAEIRVRKSSTVEELVRSTIAKSVRQLVHHHAGVWLGTDSEDVHQFRVATRRLRSDLRTFAPLLDEHWTNWLRDELQWLGGEVGRARDVDVLAARLRGQMAHLAGDDAAAVAHLERRLADNSSDARRHVVDALASERYVGLLDALVDAIHHPRFAADDVVDPSRQAGAVFVELVAKPWRRLRKAAQALTPESPDTAFHAVRILAKKARYAAEAVIPVYGRDARRFAKAMEKVQSVLGDHQDTAVAEAWLRRAAEDDQATRLVVGELITLERLDRLRLRQEFGEVWKKASRRPLSRWLR